MPPVYPDEQGHGTIQGGRIQGGRGRRSEVVGNVPDDDLIEGSGSRLVARRPRPRQATEVVIDNDDPDHDRPAATIPESGARIESIAAAMPARTGIGHHSVVVVVVVVVIVNDVDVPPVESVVLER
jgi:hypothetical protein